MAEQPDPLAPETVTESAGPRGDIYASIVMLLIAAGGGWMVLTNPELVGTDYGPDPGPGMLPQLALGLLALFSAILMARAIVALARPDRAARSHGEIIRLNGKRLGVPALMVATLLVYALVFPIVGFVWATLAFAVFWSVLLGIIEFRPAGNMAAYALYVGEAALITLLVWLAFAKLIKIPLP